MGGDYESRVSIMSHDHACMHNTVVIKDEGGSYSYKGVNTDM